MDALDIDAVDEADLDEPVLIEGLPGVGHVGKLAADHILEELEAETTLVRRIYSQEFPPQVSVDGGVTSLTCASVHAVTPETGRDMLVLTGDHQAQTNEGHYVLTDAFLDVAESFDVSELYALGGVPTGELIDEYAVLGAVNNESMLEDLEDIGVEFRDDEPAGGIVGVSGLLLGLGERRSIDATCLMGETSGYLVDPMSARAVLEILEERLEIDLEYESLDERAEEMKDVMGKIQEMENQQQSMEVPSDDDLRYIG
ncbi:proteasome assembly chaperone family protein [Halobacteria archaeon AArc-curdl1]|uniref:Proteasome assembly chaperone family protein n=1 Tax=Natronosalvus hydrolyticus TaxID=2979988 RepID=A0AAP2Z5N4_9EURY|nr:proteasome assembly chaperone family protein [Halobacteria archaeon AArc-curdl1]